jgi:hypothetical protein
VGSACVSLDLGAGLRVSKSILITPTSSIFINPPTPKQDDGVKSTTGHKFVTDRVARTRPRTPGEEVGQTLVLVGPSTPFVDVVDKIVQHRIHRCGLFV